MKSEKKSGETPREHAKGTIGDARNRDSACCLLHGALPSAFTLLELMIAVGIFGLVMAGSFAVYGMCQRMWRSTSLSMETARMASLAIERMVYGVGKNGGLRAAASISIDTNCHKDSVDVNYWDTTTNPPAANSAANDFCSYAPYPGDGSWRIVYSNDLEGVKYIDYVKQQRSIVMWSDTNQPASRQLICNYVLSVSAFTNSSGGIVISNLTVWKKAGMFVASNQLSTYVKKRNK